MQRKTVIAGGLVAAWALSACSEQAPPPPEAVARPVKTMIVAGVDASGRRSFPARIEAAQRADLAFRVHGTVQELPVKEGDRLREGDLVARLDPTDYQIVVNDRQASFSNAKKNYERGKELVSGGNISKMDFDRLEAEFKSAQAALETAQQDLTYTELKAPFDGSVARRLVERFEEVQAKQPIAVLQNVNRLEVKFDVPESIIRGVRASRKETGTDARNGVRVFATFVDQPGREYPLVFKEISTKADPQTQTFEATYLMDQWEKGVVLPGMTASVTVDLAGYVDTAVVVTVPVSAVVGDYKLAPQVWTVDESSMTVSPRAVKIGRLSGNEIELLEGIEPGTRIVTAGTPFLAEGMKVRLMPDIEQAEPRAEDLKYQQ